MDNDIVDMNALTDDVKSKLRDFNEMDAYFLLVQIFSTAQATKNYAQFQHDLVEWQKRFPIDLFSDEYKSKIKYMLSKEFLDTVLKNFVAFDELSRKDPSIGLEKLRKVLYKAEKHKNAKQLDKDLNELYKEYPLKFLKEKYPHIVHILTCQTNIDRILQEFDSDEAFKELQYIVENPSSFKSADEFVASIQEWSTLFPTSDFADKYKSDVEKIIKEATSQNTLNELFPPEMNLDEGTIIPLEIQPILANASVVCKNAISDLFKIVKRNQSDINSLFDWTCTYGKYINSFDDNSKKTIVDSLISRYGHEIPPVGTFYQIPKVENSKFLSLDSYNSIGDTKKEVILQLLGILSTGNMLSNEDLYRINIINSNSQMAQTIEKSKMEQKLDWFMGKFPEDKLTPYNNVLLQGNTDNRMDVSVNDNIDLTLHEAENNKIVVEEATVHAEEPDSFKQAIKVTEALERVTNNSSTSSSDSTTSSGGGVGPSIQAIVIETAENTIEVSKKDRNTEPITQIPIDIPIQPQYTPDSSTEYRLDPEPNDHIQDSNSEPITEYTPEPDSEPVTEYTPDPDSESTYANTSSLELEPTSEPDTKFESPFLDSVVESTNSQVITSENVVAPNTTLEVSETSSTPEKVDDKNVNNKGFFSKVLRRLSGESYDRDGRD